jgi:membrane-associated phospholipid phosphatase
LSLCVARPAAAEPAHELRIDPRPETIYTLGATGVWLGMELSRPLWAPSECRWCVPPSIDADIRKSLKADQTVGANIASYATVALTPVIVLGGLGIAGGQHGGGHFWEDTLIVGEAGATTMLVTNLFKAAFGRERPFVHALSAEQKQSREPSSDDNVSFFSGHASLAFSIATAGGTVAHLRGYDLEPYIWGVGLSLATVTGYLRLVADRHYFTDVLAGAAVGSAIGVGMPLLLHGRTTGERNIGVSPMPLGGVRGFVISGVF